MLLTPAAIFALSLQFKQFAVCAFIVVGVVNRIDVAHDFLADHIFRIAIAYRDSHVDLVIRLLLAVRAVRVIHASLAFRAFCVIFVRSPLRHLRKSQKLHSFHSLSQKCSLFRSQLRFTTNTQVRYCRSCECASSTGLYCSTTRLLLKRSVVSH